jgi:hypothetical protein
MFEKILYPRHIQILLIQHFTCTTIRGNRSTFISEALKSLGSLVLNVFVLQYRYTVHPGQCKTHTCY